MIVALGITTEGVKIALGLWEGSTENATVAGTLLVRPRRPRARSRAGDAVRDRRRPRRCARRSRRCSATTSPVQRCLRHKERNVLDHLPERDRAADQGADPPGVDARPTTTARSSSSPASRRARATPPRRRRLAARGDGRDADGDPARDHRQARSTLCSRPTRASRWCATRRHVKGENGRTTLIRAGWKTGPGLMQRPGEAGGSRGAGSRAGGGSSPDNVAAGRHCQTPACALARPKGRAKAKRWSKPLDRISSPEPGG